MTGYDFAFALGAAGLLVMGLGGLGTHGPTHGGGHHHGAHHGAHHGGALHEPGRGGAPHHDGSGHGHAVPQVGGARDALLALATPRVLFALAFGFGAAGMLLGQLLGGAPLAAAALLCAVAFERLVVAPVWRLLLRFASAPAMTLETALFDEARAASGFDANGEGLVALELDGQVVQLLGRLRAEDRPRRVRAGDRLRVEDVDPERNRCTVSYVAPA